jgi:hypothetical protein
MNLRALAATDPDTPERQRNCGAVPVGDQVEIRMKDGAAYYCGLETCGNVWLCPVSLRAAVTVSRNNIRHDHR